VGYVAVATDVVPNTFIPDLVWRLVPDELQVSKEFLAEYLSSRTVRARITSIATGTSESMRKINKAKFSSLDITVPSRTAQEAYLEPLRGARAARMTHEANLTRLRELRATLVTALLSGEHEIPQSYDELLAG
jgi:hypothetical protein